MSRRRAAIAAIWLAAFALIAVSVVWGRAYQRESPEIFLGAAPLVGRDFRDGWHWRFGWSLVGAGALAVWLAATVWRGWWWRIRLRWVIVAASLAAGVFAVLLALIDGADGILHGAVHPTEYLGNLDRVPPAGEFLRTFVDRLRAFDGGPDGYSVHVRGHPPGFLLLLMGMDALGIATGWTTAMLSVLATAVLPAGVLVTVWAVAGPDWVRRIAPLLVVPPYALWMVTSADAVFTAIGAWGVACCAVGLRGSRPLVWGALSGLFLVVLLFMTYGGATFLLVPVTLAVAVGVWRRRAGRPVRPVLVLVGGAMVVAAVVTALFWALGFWWFEGAAETRVQYWAGTAQFRTWTYFGIANIAVALIALGPATLAGLTVLRDRRVWAIVAGGTLALLASHLSQYTRGEVERIWLLFYPWIAVAGGALVLRHRPLVGAVWIGVQAACAIVLQAALVSKW